MRQVFSSKKECILAEKYISPMKFLNVKWKKIGET